jgi:hypothetical protein
MREHLEGLVARGPDKRGYAEHVAKLQGSEYPDCIEYMRDWLSELHGRSGVGMSGFNPLTYSTIAHWSRLTETRVESDEVRALILLDAIMLNPGEME